MVAFIQYLRPDGRQITTSIERPPQIEALARRVVAAGGRFESEVLLGNDVSLECVGPEDDAGDAASLAIELVANGPGVPGAVDRLVQNAAMRLGVYGG